MIVVIVGVLCCAVLCVMVCVCVVCNVMRAVFDTSLAALYTAFLKAVNKRHVPFFTNIVNTSFLPSS